MSFNGFDEFPDRPQTTSKSSAHPTLDKPLCSLADLQIYLRITYIETVLGFNYPGELNGPPRSGRAYFCQPLPQPSSPLQISPPPQVLLNSPSKRTTRCLRHAGLQPFSARDSPAVPIHKRRSATPGSSSKKNSVGACKPQFLNSSILPIPEFNS